MATTVTFTDIQAAGQQHATVAPVQISLAAYQDAPSGKRFAQQGDLYFCKLADVPADAIRAQPYAQLAPGESLGSRHCLDSLAGVQMFHLLTPGPLDGPVLVLSQARTVTHPEHGHITFPAGACMQVTYQRLYGDTVRRVED